MTNANIKSVTLEGLENNETKMEGKTMSKIELLKAKKEKKIEAAEEEFNWAKHKLLYPRKEGIKNFKKLSKPEQWDVAADHPRFRKNDKSGKLERRTYIAYFPENKTEEGNSVTVAGYSSVRDDVLAVTAIAAGVAAFFAASKKVGEFIVARKNK